MFEPFFTTKRARPRPRPRRGARHRPRARRRPAAAHRARRAARVPGAVARGRRRSRGRATDAAAGAEHARRAGDRRRGSRPRRRRADDRGPRLRRAHRAPTAPPGSRSSRRTAIDAVLVDMTMPRMSGARRDRRSCARAAPTCRSSLCSGFDRDGAGPGPRRRLPAQAVPDRRSGAYAGETTAPLRHSCVRLCRCKLCRSPPAHGSCLWCPRDRNPLASIKVLLVEDDARLAQLTARYLESHGVLVTVAGDGIEGQAEALRRQYDCIVLDLMLPGPRRHRGLPRAARAHRRADHDGHRARRGSRSRARPRGRRRRLRHQAVLAARAARPDPRERAPRPRPGRPGAGDDPGRRRSCSIPRR